MKLEISDWNMIPYAGAWSRQTEWFDALVHAKQAGEGYVNHIVLCEHPHVYTLGRSGKERNMLLGEEQLRRIGATLYHIDRGGDITYHGPGQLVCYPILNLEDFSLGLKEYVHLLEEAVIRVCASFGIAAGRLEKATGVWLEGDTPRARKICAIGVRSSHFVTMHGLALNVNTDLRYFSYINPCGFIDKGVTSLQKELGHEVPMEEVKERLCKKSKLGEGSCFTVILPFKIDTNARPEEKEDFDADISDIRILLVEDNELNAEIAEFMLTENGAKVETVNNGLEAVQHFEASAPGTYDVILMDVMMPVMDGLTATRTIRALERQDAKTIPIIAMTANAFREDAERCMEAGMNAHLAKPLDDEKIKQTISEELRKQNACHE